MNMINQINKAIEYIEDNLCNEIKEDDIAKIACISTKSFLSFFSYMTGMSLKEYIRRRRLSVAAVKLQQENWKIIDIALKYQYNTPDSFSRAFKKQHGILPKDAKKYRGTINIYPPVSFNIIVKGGKEVNFKIESVNKIVIRGIKRKFAGEGYGCREELRHLMWDSNSENIPGKICEGQWNDISKHNLDGIWYGVWKDGFYMIGREEEKVQFVNLESYTILNGTYAMFRTEKGVAAWEKIPQMFELIFEAWLPKSGYKLRNDEIIEVYHLWADYDIRNKNRYYEVWIPIEPIKDNPFSEVQDANINKIV